MEISISDVGENGKKTKVYPKMKLGIKWNAILIL
jgi:hypothetical protein